MIFAILLVLSILFNPIEVSAIYDPLSVPNNKYGIHVADTNDIADAALLVNGTGGDWGYVTVVIPDNDLNIGKWQGIMNTMRRKHIIPIVRVATHIEGESWVKPQDHNIEKWVDFLDKLNWPVENRYVVLFNEPNHANEWGNTIDPEGYGSMLIKFNTALKQRSQDFFILPAGLDASAASDGSAMDEEVFIRRMIQANPDVFSHMDGWTSHSYPNPGFSGSPYAYGRGTLATFLWEQDLFIRLGISKNLPIFITETGWQHAGGKYYDNRLLSSETVGNNFLIASQTVWQNPDIAAVTPFVFNYQDYPFDHFSFKLLGSTDYYPQYFSYQEIEKTKGTPKQRESFVTNPMLLSDSLVMNSTYMLESTMTNTAQSIIDPQDGYLLTVHDASNLFQSFADALPLIEPNESGKIRIMLKTPSKEGIYPLSLVVTHNTKRIVIEEQSISVIPPPSATIGVTLGWTKNGNAVESTVLVYNESDILIHKFTDVPIRNGKMTITGLYQVVPGRRYRIVVLVPYYLPRQEYVTMKEKNNNWVVRRLYPFDFNKDGAFTLADIMSMFLLSPKRVFDLVF